MSLFRPTELHLLLNRLGKKPKRGLSQNFLVDGNILNKIINYANIQPNDLVLEIGSGPGALTQVLLQKGARVIAIEKDPLFATALNQLQTDDHRLQVISEDFLKINLQKFLENIPSLKVVANIPYNITTPIILSLITHYPKISLITLMVQKEVATRFIAQPGCGDYSSLTLLLQYYADISFGFNVEPTCFYPSPSIRSAVVQFTLKKTPEEPFPERFIRTAFQQRRKMIRSSLKKLFPVQKIEKSLIDLGLKPEVRPEELSLKDFISLYSALNRP